MGIKTPEVKAYWKARGRSQPSAVVPRYLSGGGRASAFMSRNTAYGPTSYNAGAIAMGNDDGIVRIKHREFIGVINSSTAFTTQRYEINPGLKIYPWISSIANSFQQYRVNNMAWEFVSTSAVAISSGTNNALGQISIGTQYDSLQPPFRNLNDILNSQWATSTRVSENLIHAIESEKYHTTAQPLYVRAGRVPGDIRLYDIAASTFAVYGCQSTGDQIGQIFLSYDITLLKQNPFALDGGGIESAFYTCYPAVRNAPFFSPTLPLSDLQFANIDSMGLTINQANGDTYIELPAGSSAYYVVGIALFPPFTATTLQPPTAGTFVYSNCLLVDNIWGQNPYINPPPYSNAGNAGQPGNSLTYPNYTFVINVIDPNVPARLTFNSDWTIMEQMNYQTGAVNVVVSQLDIGFSKFQPTPKQSLVSGNVDCCDSLQQQINQLTLLVEQLQADEEESDNEEEKQNERISRNEKLAVLGFEKLQVQINECCHDDYSPLHCCGE